MTRAELKSSAKEQIRGKINFLCNDVNCICY